MRRNVLIGYVAAQNTSESFEYTGTPESSGVIDTVVDCTKPWELSADVQAVGGKTMYDTYNAWFGLAENNVTSQLMIRNMRDCVKIYKIGDEITLSLSANYRLIYRIVATFRFSALTDINSVNKAGNINLEYAHIDCYGYTENDGYTKLLGSYDFDVTGKKIEVNLVDMHIYLNKLFLYNSLTVKYL